MELEAAVAATATSGRLKSSVKSASRHQLSIPRPPPDAYFDPAGDPVEESCRFRPALSAAADEVVVQRATSSCAMVDLPAPDTPTTTRTGGPPR